MRPFGISTARGRRSVPRTLAPAVVLLSTANGDYRSTLVDLSRTGARVSSDLLPPLGEPLTFIAAEVRAVGEVVWRDTNICAVQFETPIAITEVLRIRSLHSINDLWV